MKGKVETVLGTIDPSQLGRTLTHEHLSINATPLGVSLQQGQEDKSNAPFTLENIGWIQQYPYSHPENLNASSVNSTAAFRSTIIEELKIFKSLGGGTIVENTTHGITRDATFLKEASIDTGVNIVAGTGFYVSSAQSESIRSMTQEQLSSLICQEFTEGCVEEPTVKCGILGEIGNSWPITEFEKKSLRASGVVSELLGCPVMIHPGRNPEAPTEAVRYFSEAGGDVRKLVMGHMDRTILEDDMLLQFAKLGSYIEYDLFGVEKSYYQQQSEIDMPSDAQRIAKIKTLIEEGYEDRIVISQDIHTRHRMTNYGGHGYSHILKLIIPMMLQRKITQSQIDKILIHNPSSWLAFSK